MMIIYIVNLFGGMFFGWIFLLTSFNTMRSKPQNNNIEYMASLQDLDNSANSKEYQTVKINNHTHFIFKKDIPNDLNGKDCRISEENNTEKENNEIHKMHNLFRKLAILNQLSSPGNPQTKLDIIRKEKLEIHGDVEIRGVNVKKWLEDLENFTDPSNDNFE